MGKTHEYSYEAFQYQLEMNLHTSFLVAKHCLRRMLETGYGRMVMISSRVTEQPLGQMAAYGAAKAGLEGMTRAIAEETKGTNITANVVSPSIIDTPGTRQAMGPEKAVNWVKADSLAEVICFLASEAAGDIRGAVVPVYGNT
nr:SDR family oxidoreductase [[Phormidium] sp. ETS-05]